MRDGASASDSLFAIIVREKNGVAQCTRARRTPKVLFFDQREWFSKEACSIPDLPPNAEKARPEIPFLDHFVVFEKDGHFPGFAFIGFLSF